MTSHDPRNPVPPVTHTLPISSIANLNSFFFQSKLDIIILCMSSTTFIYKNNVYLFIMGNLFVSRCLVHFIWKACTLFFGRKSCTYTYKVFHAFLSPLLSLGRFNSNKTELWEKKRKLLHQNDISLPIIMGR